MNRFATFFLTLILFLGMGFVGQAFAQVPFTGGGEQGTCECVKYETIPLFVEEPATYNYTLYVLNNCPLDLSYVEIAVYDWWPLLEYIVSPAEGIYPEYTVEHTRDGIKFEGLAEPNVGDTLAFVFTLGNSNPEYLRRFEFKKGPYKFSCYGKLPVELGGFTGTADGSNVLLRWETFSETNNAGFVLQHRAADIAKWDSLGFVEGFGTTIEPRDYRFRATGFEPGTHTFRLKQVDFDGAFEYSPEVEVVVGLAETYVLEAAYPNPFNPEATMRFAVAQAQQVEVVLYNTLGQRVRTLYTGMAESGQMHVVQIDGSNLPSGLYLIRVQGERFAETQTITLLK